MLREKFIEKAVMKHGDVYDYSQIPEEINVNDKAPIICKKHGLFMQSVDNHIHNGAGCPVCGRKVIITKLSDTFDNFVKKAREVHGDKYDYVEESFVKTSDPLKIYCKKCGNFFFQKGKMHLRGNGCNICNPPHTRLTQEQFVEKLSKTHPNLDVLSEYCGSDGKITVRCKIHDYTYVTTPHRLASGANCQKCYDDRRGETIRKTPEDCFKQLMDIHGEKYTFPYFWDEYIDTRHKITCLCPKHGEFKITVNKLLVKHGCGKCADEQNGFNKRLSVETVIKRSNEVHNGKYRFLNLADEYKGYDSIVTVVCPEHGVFKQNIGSHLHGAGCTICNSSRLEVFVSRFLPNATQYKHFDWLGMQSLDFYLEDENVAIECQGGQHFNAVDFFGGEEGFEKTLERDIRKNCLCQENNVPLIYIVQKDYEKYLSDDKFEGIYSKNVIFKEDIEEGRVDLLNEIMQFRNGEINERDN